MNTKNNKLIAEFMGGKKEGGGFYFLSQGRHYTESDLKYSFSYDWIIPVVKKILKINLTNKISKDFIAMALLACDLELINQSVIEFINIYNKQKGGAK